MRVWRLPVWLVRGAVRVVVVAVLVAASVAPLQHTFDPHDPGCCAQVVVHDPSQHRFEASVPRPADEAGDHCAACHAARTFSSAGLAASGRPVLDAGVQLTCAPTSAPRPQLDLRLPARAPPVLA